MSSNITLIALAAAAGLLVGWFLCHLAHTAVRSDARHYRDEAEVLRTKAIRIDEQRLSAQAEADALYRELSEMRHTLSVDAKPERDEESVGFEEPVAVDLSERGPNPGVAPPSRPAPPRRSGETGRLAEAFGTD